VIYNLKGERELKGFTAYAVDPGDKHVGFAAWSEELGMVSHEFDTDEFLEWLDQVMVGGVDVLVIESFRLYATKAKAQINSPMATAELIGAMKWIASVYKTQVVMQPAAIKGPTRAQCRARGLYWKVASGHASDARLHLWHYLLRNGKV
jgi:hypothetical protein